MNTPVPLIETDTNNPILPAYIDSTMLSCFRGCPQKFFNEFVLGLRPGLTSIDLHAGGAFAHARETFCKAYYGDPARDLNAAIRRAHHAFTHYWGDVEAPEKSPKTQGNVWLAFLEYLNTFPPATDHIQPYFSSGVPTFEFTFAIPLEGSNFPRHPTTKEPFLYSGRFDMLGTYHGRPVVLDDKTTKAAGVKWADQWTLRSQFMGYVWACQQEGINLDTVAIRGVVIQKTSIRVIEAIKAYPPYLLELWHENLARDLHRIVDMWDDYTHRRDLTTAPPQRAFPYNLADACGSYGGCMFVDLCSSRPENHAEWAKTFKVRRWNPLEQDPLKSKEVYDARIFDAGKDSEIGD